MTVNKKILDYLRDKGISQADLANRIGMAQQNLSRLLNGNDLKVSLLIRICNAIEVNPAFFFEGSAVINREQVKKLEARVNELERLDKMSRILKRQKFMQLVTEILYKDFAEQPESVKEAVKSSFNETFSEMDTFIEELSELYTQPSREHTKTAITSKIAEIRANRIRKIRSSQSDEP